MKRVHQIIYQETISPTLIALVVLSFVVFTREFGRLAELLIQKNADPAAILQVVLYLIPSILVFTIPFSFLIGTLVGFSRLAADSEIIAMRAGGVSVVQMLWPSLKLGLLVTALTAAFTLSLLPNGNWNLRTLRHLIRFSPAETQIKPRIFYEELGGLLLYVEDIDPEDSVWKGIFVADTTADDEKRIILAKQGRSLADVEGKRLQLHFEDGTIYTTPNETPDKIQISRFGTLDIPIELPTGEPVTPKVKRPRDKTIGDLVVDIRQGEPQQRHSSQVELNRRIALPLSGIIFAVLGVSLGSRSPRVGRGYGFFISVVMAFIYYILFATGSTLSNGGVLPISVGVWGANIFAAVLAVFVMRRADSETTLFERLMGFRWLKRTGHLIKQGVRKVGKVFARFGSYLRRARRSTSNARLRLTRVIDIYLIRIFFTYFGATLLICLSLVTLFTFFELIDDIFEHHTSYRSVLEYFVLVQPHFVMLLVPISVLIGTLITFGTLEKSNQIVALKSCGVSIYQAALPVFLIAAVIAGFLFVMQERILPYANQRQDNLRNIIKGNPTQTSQPGRHWIFGEEDRLYNYYYFNSRQDRLVELMLYRLNDDGGTLSEMLYARTATWNRETQSWLLEDGWLRGFPEGSFERFEERHLPVAETPMYFDEGVRNSSKMTYLELQEYVDNLRQGGFEVEYLQTELYKKLSFPVVSLIMALIGLPFALTMGKKGALYGIAAGAFIGIVYWGAFGVFDVLGSNGLLAPLLAAWGPNILFSSGAAVLISSTRT